MTREEGEALIAAYQKKFEANLGRNSFCNVNLEDLADILAFARLGLSCAYPSAEEVEKVAKAMCPFNWAVVEDEEPYLFRARRAIAAIGGK